MMDANPIRGEQRITLGGEGYVMRPTFAAIQAIEDATGLGLFDLGMQAEGGRLRAGHVAIIVAEFVKADLLHQKKSVEFWNANRVGELLLESEGGLFEAIKSLVTILGSALTGGYTAKGEAKAATETDGKKTDTPAAA